MTEGSKGGVQSVEIGIGLLKTLAAMGGKVSLNQLSEETGMHPAKIHRYLTSLVNTGLVARTAHGKYDLGSYGLEFSTLYLSRLDPTTIANEMMESLRDQTAEGVILTVWGSAGTTVIRWFQSRQPISVGIRPGTCFSTLMSASGRVFMAHLPTELTQPQVEQELLQLEQKPHRLAPQGWDEIAQINAETRQHGLGRVEGHSVEGVSALAAPIFDYRGEMVLSLALFGFRSRFDADWDGRNARLLRQTAGEISSRLGYIAPA
ncbi:IclR family transcriptional regulator [Marinobacterium jannaschii]|uniref:IclR family transcriptional regulator n=1 Tax=Marinobacterium jannaschii TaxID=64970 RepID=UPI00047F06E8|nr:IclR family transcriptional regulator [Marinobacterium jannaschii]